MTSSGRSISLLLALILILLTGCAGDIGKSLSGEEGRREPPRPEEAPEEVKPDDDGETGTAPAAEEALTADVLPEKEGLPAVEEPKASASSRKSAEYDFDSPAAARPAPPAESGLQAGYSDDNRQYGYFLTFLEEYGETPHFDLPVDERIMLKVRDSRDRPLPNAEVQITSGTERITGTTLADGTYQLNPSLFAASATRFTVTAVKERGRITETVTRAGPRVVTLTMPEPRRIPDPVPLDIMFIMDTTGSMGEEIQRLKATIEIIDLNLSSLTEATEVRFGMVLYKDKDDEYRTKTIPLTADLDAFRAQLNEVTASGGGDHPEDLQEALRMAVTDKDWNRDGIRLGFVITDAPPHLDYNQSFNYTRAAREARRRGIKIFTVGTGGLNIQGEYILRQIAQFTSGKYIFLTYGESGESAGGEPGSVSHHTGANWQADKLESIIIRFAKEELSQLTDKPLDEADPWLEARKIGGEEQEEILGKLFAQAATQLKNFSTYPVTAGTPAALLPFRAEEAHRLQAEYFTEQCLLSLGKDEAFTLVDRRDLQAVSQELKLQHSGLTDEETVQEIGRLLNAEVLITGQLFRREESFELFLRLLKVETGEMMAATRAVIAEELGL